MPTLRKIAKWFTVWSGFSITGNREKGGQTPGWIAQVDSLWSVVGVESAKEEGAEVVCARTGDSLYAVEYHQKGEIRDLVRPTDLATRSSFTAGD